MPEKPTIESAHVYSVCLQSTLRSRSSEKNAVQVKRDDTVRQICTTLFLSRILIYACDHLSWLILLLGYFILISVNNNYLKWQLFLEFNGNPSYSEYFKTYF